MIFVTNMLIVILILRQMNSSVDVSWDFKETVTQLAIKLPQVYIFSFIYVVVLFLKNFYLTKFLIHYRFTFLDFQDCRSQQNCHQDASCEFDNDEGRFLCLCHSGTVQFSLLDKVPLGMLSKRE